MNRTMFIGTDIYYSHEFVDEMQNDYMEEIRDLNNIIDGLSRELEIEKLKYKSLLNFNYGKKVTQQIKDKKIKKLDLDWIEVFHFKEQAQQDCVKMVFNKINEIIDKDSGKNE